jgi:DNA-binding NarL/FixJ family response regulator
VIIGYLSKHLSVYASIAEESGDMDSEGNPWPQECGCEAARYLHKIGHVLTRVQRLSDRELEVFGLLAEGASNRAISSQLRITERTAKAHVSQILIKMDLRSRTQVAIAAFAWKLRIEIDEMEAAALQPAGMWS